MGGDFCTKTLCTAIFFNIMMLCMSLLLVASQCIGSCPEVVRRTPMSSELTALTMHDLDLILTLGYDCVHAF